VFDGVFVENMGTGPEILALNVMRFRGPETFLIKWHNHVDEIVGILLKTR